MKRRNLLATAALVAAMVSPWMSCPALAGSPTNSNTNTNHNTNTTTVTTQSNSSASVDVVSALNFNGGGNPNQPGGISVPSPSAGYCGGLSGGFALGFASFSVGASMGDIEKACAQDRHIGVGMSDPVTRPEAERLWFSMNQDMFGNAGKSQTSAAPGSATVAPVALQAGVDNSACNSNLPTVQYRMCMAKAGGNS